MTIQTRRTDCSLSRSRAFVDISTTCESNSVTSIQGAFCCAALALIGMGLGSGLEKGVAELLVPSLQSVVEHSIFPAYAAEQVEVGEHLACSERDRG